METTVVNHSLEAAILDSEAGPITDCVASAPKPPGDNCKVKKISRDEAESIASDVFAALGLSHVKELRPFLIRILAQQNREEGDALSVIAKCHLSLISATRDVDAHDSHVAYIAEFLRFLLQILPEMAEDRSLMPWCNLADYFREMHNIEGVASRDRSETESDYFKFLAQIRKSGLLRRRCRLPDPSAILALVPRFPNFVEPLRFIAEQAALSFLREDEHFSLVPILLTGPAGVGKTHFATALAEVLGIRAEMLSMASQSCGFTLSGMDRGWSTARAGLVFDALRHGDSLSPIIVVDEIDKVNSDSRSDPLGPLYTLLEPRSSRLFRDEFAGFPVNASQVFWVATANDIDKIPLPLLSRFRCFSISEPSSEEIVLIAKTLYREIVRDLKGVPSSIPDDWVRLLSGRSLREIRLALQQAIGRAALRAILNEQRVVTLECDDLHLDKVGATRKIGFL